MANEATPFALDYFLITHNPGGGPSDVRSSLSGPSSTSSVGTSPSSTSTSSGLPIVATQPVPVGTIVGVVVGGIVGVAILVLALLWYFMRKRSHGGKVYYFEKPDPAGLVGECS